MWLLRNDEKGQIYRITPGKQHIVSRKDGDLLLLGDQSISRKHAQLIVQHENGDEGIILKDLGSKYGSFTVIGDGELTRLQEDQQVTLRDGDYVRFGSQWNSWRAEFVPLVVASSTLNQQEKASVKGMVEALGGQMVSEWTERCSHITMNKLTVTIKVVCALAAAQRIVTPAYWQSLSEALGRMQSTLPNADDFLPALAEAILNPSEVSFTPNPARSQIFKGWTFVTATAKQTARIRPMITAAGGNVVDFSLRSWSENQLTQENVVLMQHSPGDKQGSQQSQVPDGYNPIARKLRAAGVRCVPESEIGLAIIYCSTSKFCNPRHSPSLLKPSQASSGQATQPMTQIGPSLEPSVSSDNNMDCSERPTSSKRPSIPSNDEEPKKKAKNGDSEDMFGSQDSINAGLAQTLRQTSLKLQRSNPSNDSSGASKPKPSNNPAPSLDMFAPSGERSGRPVAINGEEPAVKPAMPSCEDMFASDKGLQANKTSNDKDEQSFKSNKPLRNVTNEDDEFSFVSSKKSKRPRDVTADENDDFSFVQTKKPNNKTVERNEVDEFSFTSTRKRNRQSGPDMFASSSESAGTDSVSSLSKIRKTGVRSDNPSSSKFGIQNSNRNDDDNLFAFPNDRKLKKNSSNVNSDGVLESGEEVKLAILSIKKEPASELNGLKTNNEAQMYIRPARKDLITYGKTVPAPDKLNKEVKEEEVDVLAQELQDTTIVVVKSLLANREKPAATQPNVTGKNFKKFQKVVGVNKRLVPKIIGGSDLVPYCKSDRRSPSPKPQPLPQQNTHNDIWSFGNSRKRR